MGDSLSHRGPDGQGFFALSSKNKTFRWQSPGQGPEKIQLGLAHRRLSILDLSNRALQPMNSQDGRYWICFNGEIYNYVELKTSLSHLSFKTTSDSEVLLELFAKNGLNSLNQLNGMFAFAIYDLKNSELFLVRDPLGIKPLYYSISERGLAFTSEIKALKSVLPGKLTPRKEMTARYLATHAIPDPETLYEGIYKLPPGHFLRVDRNGVGHPHEYWEFDFTPETDKTLSYWEKQLDERMHATVERQLRSDVPVGFFLSGGVDSSLLAAQGTRRSQKPPTTFTIGFRWAERSDDHLDLKCAKLLGKRYPFNQREFIVEPSIVDLLPKVISTLEEPIADPAAICSYLICQAASQANFKVLMSGQGGDEVFGGYDYYRNGQWVQLVHAIPPFLKQSAKKITDLLPYTHKNRRLQKLLTMANYPWSDSLVYLRSGFNYAEIQSLFTPDALYHQLPPLGRHLDHLRRVNGKDIVTQLQYLDTKTYLPNINLTYTDKTSMAHSVEVRVPYLDLELIRLLNKIPRRYKSTLRQNKILLKRHSKKYLPQSIIYRKKTGFGLPIRDWFRNDLYPLAKATLLDNSQQNKQLFQLETIENWLKEHHEGRADHSFKIYSLLSLRLWQQTL